MDRFGFGAPRATGWPHDRVSVDQANWLDIYEGCLSLTALMTCDDRRKLIRQRNRLFARRPRKTAPFPIIAGARGQK